MCREIVQPGCEYPGRKSIISCLSEVIAQCKLSRSRVKNQVSGIKR